MGQAGTEGRRAMPELGGVAGWLWTRLRRNARPRPRLALVERITLGPRQSLALVEADGRRFLVATSAEGSPAFYPLAAQRKTGRARVSW
jgi:flagellar biogenesis protein FliO